MQKPEERENVDQTSHPDWRHADLGGPGGSLRGGDGKPATRAEQPAGRANHDRTGKGTPGIPGCPPDAIQARIDACMAVSGPPWHALHRYNTDSPTRARKWSGRHLIDF